MRLRICCLLVVTCFIAVGCSSSSSPSPLFFGVPGPAPMVYAGTVTDSSLGSGTLTVSILTNAGLTAGSWEMAFGRTALKWCISGTVSDSIYTARINDCPDTTSGVVSGQVASRVDATPSGPDCELSLTGTLTSSSLGGNYTPNSASCAAQVGSIRATRQ